jgi:hypothetical protein
MTFKKVEPKSDIWTPHPGDDLVGTVAERVVGMFGEQLVIEDERTHELVRTPSHKVLQSRLADVLLGARVRIVALADLPPKVRGQNPTKMYEVYVDDGESI